MQTDGQNIGKNRNKEKKTTVYAKKWPFIYVETRL